MTVLSFFSFSRILPSWPVWSDIVRSGLQFLPCPDATSFFKSFCCRSLSPCPLVPPFFSTAPSFHFSVSFYTLLKFSSILAFPRLLPKLQCSPPDTQSLPVICTSFVVSPPVGQSANRGPPGTSGVCWHVWHVVHNKEPCSVPCSLSLVSFAFVRSFFTPFGVPFAFFLLPFVLIRVTVFALCAVGRCRSTGRLASSHRCLPPAFTFPSTSRSARNQRPLHLCHGFRTTSLRVARTTYLLALFFLALFSNVNCSMVQDETLSKPTDLCCFVNRTNYGAKGMRAGRGSWAEAMRPERRDR